MKVASRLLALLLLVSVLAGIGIGGALPLWRKYEGNLAEIAQSRDHIARLTGIATGLDSMEKEIRRLEEQRESSDYTLARESLNFAAASLQERLKLIVQRSGGTLTSTQVAPPARVGPFDRVTLDVRMSLSLGGLQEVLHVLEGGSPYLIVDNLTVIARPTRRINKTELREQSLDVRMSLSGFMSREEKA